MPIYIRDGLERYGNVLMGSEQNVGLNGVECVTFPYRKLYILDNKLEFSGIKLAESYGFRYSNFKVNSQVIQVSLWCFKFKPFGYFRLQWYWLYPHDGTGSPSWRRKQPMCLFKG